MVMGGGALVVFLLLIGLFVWIMMRTDKDKLFDAADSDYRGGSYVQAIAKYNTFIEKFGADDRASLARVRIGLAKLWQATPNGANWSTALQVAEEEVNKMAMENAFKDAHSDLASLLSKIAENLVAEARKKPTADLVAKARKALEMAENPRYVPKELRPESKLGEARASLGIAEHELARGNELDKALAAMQKATKASKTADAYAACGTLLHQYPDMTNDPRLKKMLLAVSAAQQALVQPVSEAKSAAKDEAQTATIRSVTLAQCDAKGKVGDADGQIALAAVDGAVYGLDAVTGRVLWRRMVGFDANPQAATFPPTPLSPEPGSDALVVATAHNELLRLEAATGRLKWRYVVGEPFDANPVIAGDKILVATRSGKLITIAAASGRIEGLHPLPSAAQRRSGRRRPPRADLPGRLAYQPLHPRARPGRLQARRLPRPRSRQHYHGAGDDRRLPLGGRQRRRQRLRVAGIHDRAESVGQARSLAQAGAGDSAGRASSDVAAGRRATGAGHHQLRRRARFRAQRHRREESAPRGRQHRHRRRRRI